MLIADKNEAFRHNSCKKLAQLSKVIFAMMAQDQDQSDMKNELSRDFDEVIEDLIQQHQYQLDLVFNQLYKYRKNCITSSCKDFGAKYKKMKADYSLLISEKYSKINDLLNETKKIQKEIRDFQMLSLQSAAKFLDFSEVVERELKTKCHSSKSIQSKNIRQAVKPILEKIVAYEDILRKKFDEIKAKYVYEKKLLSDEHLNIIKNLFFQVKPFLVEKKGQISVMRKEIDYIRTQRLEDIIHSYQVFSKEKLKYRNKMIADTSQTIQQFEKQKNNMLNQPNADSCTKSVVSKLQEIKITNQIKFKENYDYLSKEARRIKHQRHNLKRSQSSEISKIEREVTDFHKNQYLFYENQKNKAIESFKYHQSLIDAALNDTEHLLGSLHQKINISIKSENSQSAYFLYGSEQQLNSSMNLFDNFSQTYQKNTEMQFLEFTILLDKLSSINQFTSEIEANKKLAFELNELKTRLQEKKVSKCNKLQKEIEKYIKTCNDKSTNRSEENVLILNKKKEIKNQKLDETKQTFIHDLGAKKEQIKESNKLKLAEFMKSSVKGENKDQKNVHKTEITKLNAKLNFWEQQISQIQSINKKKIDVLDLQINNMDKSIRQFRRSIKNETQNIDEEFEMKIQVQQVDLRNKIENISKLYSKEENSRGCEIIEAIRKVSEAKNRKLNILLRKEREKNDISKSYKEKIGILQQKIGDFISNKKETELNQKVLDEKSKLAKIQSELEKKRSDEVTKIKIEIENRKNNNKGKIKAIKDLTDNEKLVFDKENEQILLQKNQIFEDLNLKIREIDAKYEAKTISLNSNHNKELETIQNKIKHAQKSYVEYLNRCHEEENILNRKNEEEIYGKKHYFYENLKLIEFMDIFNKLKILVSKKISLSNPIEPFDMKSESNIKLNNLCKRAIQKTQNLSNEFNKHIENMSIIFEGPPEETRTPVFIGKKQTSPRNIVLFENNNHKRIPQLVTPQFVQ